MLLRDMAAMLGNSTAVARYQARIQSLILAFNAAFYDAGKKCYGKNGATCLQTENAMGLWLKAVPAGDLEAVLNNTIEDIMETHSVHTTSGILGIKWVTGHGGSNPHQYVLPDTASTLI